MGADGIAISFVTPEQGEVLTGIEHLINREIPADRIEGFEAFAPRVEGEQDPTSRPNQPAKVFGRMGRKYSNRL